MRAILDFVWDKSPWWLQCLMMIFIAPIGVFGLSIGAYMFIENWTMEKAYTAIAPLEYRMTVLERVTTHNQQRIESELRMIRSQNDKLYNILIKRK